MKYQTSLEHFKNKWTVEDCKRRGITQAITVYNAKNEEEAIKNLKILYGVNELIIEEVKES